VANKKGKKTKEKRDDHKLPDNIRFSSRQLVTLFLKPKFVLKMRGKRARINENGDGEVDASGLKQLRSKLEIGFMTKTLTTRMLATSPSILSSSMKTISDPVSTTILGSMVKVLVYLTRILANRTCSLLLKAKLDVFDQSLSTTRRGQNVWM
jgi:hypothetical protein